MPLILIVAAALAAAPGPIQARDAEPPAAMKAMMGCRGLADDAARLACYDKAAASLGEAQMKGEIVVIDRAQAEAAHKEAFGLSLPSLSFVTGALRPDEVDRVEGAVRAARVDASGYWTLELEDGAVWRQIDGILLRPPRAGSKVSIRRAMLGSFMIKIDGQAAVRAHRDR